MATRTEEIISRQQAIAQQITDTLRNFKKDGPQRKTREYLEKRLKELEQYWSSFFALHEQLEQTLPKDHPYYLEQLHEKTYDIYKTAFELISNYGNENNPLAIRSGQTPTTVATSVFTFPTTTTTVTLPTKLLTSPCTSVHVSSPITATVPTTSQTTSFLTVPITNDKMLYHTSSGNPSALQIQADIPQQQAIPLQYVHAGRDNSFPKLPPIKIPKFSGDYKDWKSFIDIFTNVIHNNTHISEVEKMQYLLYHLEGDARRVINHLQLSSHNYGTALQLIQARFDNNRKIITTYVNTIIDVKNIEHRSQDDIIMLYDTIRECLEGLKNLNCNTDEWGPMIVCIAMRKLDAESLRLFEESLRNPREMPSVDDLLRFLEKRHQVLDCIRSSKQLKPNISKNFKKSFHATLKGSCAFCNKDHNLYKCGEFKKMNIEGRQEFVRQKKLCPNCLVHNRNERCKSNKLCVVCNKRHHTLLHQSFPCNSASAAITPKVQGNDMVTQMATKSYIIHKAEEQRENNVSCHVNNSKFPNVLLPTAMVRIKNLYGQLEQFRALIDPGSQVSLITEEAAQILKLRKEPIRASIFGVGDTESAKTHNKVNVSIQLRHQKDSYLSVDALVLSKLNSLLPEAPASGVDIKKYKNIVLADPTFDKPGPIDLLLGADVYANILIDGFQGGQPAAQNTKLGWIIFGNVPNGTKNTLRVANFLSLVEIEDTLKKFWEIEGNQTSTQADDPCEQHFKRTHTRDSEGRYVVALPFKENVEKNLGQSRKIAVARLMQLEDKLQKEPKMLAEYNAFLTEYLALGHMTPAKPQKEDESTVYYLPHRAVLKDDSTTTKLRVVFDASCKSKSGLSLNDLLHCGPKIQQNLTQIMLRWRKYRYVYTADIEKMFRQIKITEADRNYQRILWRQQPTGPIKEFTLNTVTYGTAPATYLAVRTLQQLAEDHGIDYPIGKKVLTTDFYVDDMLTGADTKEQAVQLQEQIITLLKEGGFNLRKWTSNNEELLRNTPDDLIEKGILEIKEDDTIKTLGIHWNPKRDEFQFKIKIDHGYSIITRRILLSKIASIFDPLGWLSPVTIKAKLLMQSLCKVEADWDIEAPSEITNDWRSLEKELGDLREITIPRWINYHTHNEIQLHGFCDASEKGCAAAIYTRTVDSLGNIHTTLLTAKTKVVPLKQKISLPRLELCGALLLANLLKSTIATLEIDSPTIVAWCDSEITLAWIAKSPNTWETYVANRVAEIQKLLPNTTWRHVPSQDNPADAATRGIRPRKLASHKIWWRGPLWLSQPPEAWPSNKLNILKEEEVGKKQFRVLNTQVSCSDMFTHSTFTRQVRTIAYCRRFIYNCRVPESRRNVNYLTTEELQKAKLCIIKIVQQEAFHDEIVTLLKDKPLIKSSKLLSLHPVLDADGMLRVGGRINNSTLSGEAKHQILLPQKNHITNLIIDHAHQQTLHGGAQLTLNYVRSQYWIINAKRIVQSRIHRCIKCLRYRQQSPQQLMGSLPAVRLTPSPPFSHCGVDYAGPFITKMTKGRGTKTLKGYISLFICMVTKAVHLELVSDLTTDAFLAAYRRFVARRGNAKQIFSDNGTNFVGAHNKLDKELSLAIAQSTKQAAEVTANDGTEWSFIPAASPHFGGLWEAGVKSVKTHLKRVLGETLLTYEEFTTVLYQVEACLNSRPIGQQSSDPRDLEPLTPGHFLIGRPLLAPPEPDISNKKIHDRWKQLTKYQQDIWRRWSEEYLNTLQQRSKWKTKRENPAIGELVLIKDDNLPPLKWSLGRIVELHPGEDGMVRIVSVHYKNGVKKRPLNKLCQLPISIHNSGNEISDHKATVGVTTAAKSNPNSSCRKRTRVTCFKHEEELWSKPEHFDQSSSSFNNKALDSPVKKKRIRIAPCTWATKLLHSAILILCWLTTVFARDYEIFQARSGFYIENLGYAQVKRGNLRLQITLPTEEMIQDLKMIDSTWTRIRQMCEKNKRVTEITHCDVLFQHLSTRRQNLLRDANQIIQLAQHKDRKKRGILGNLLTTIFGVNDEIYTDIEHLQHNQESLLQTTNQQVLFLNSRINQSNYIIQEKLKLFDTRLSKATASINEMASWITSADHNRIGIEIISTYISAEDYYNELGEKYSRWLNAIHEQGHLLNFVAPHEINEIIERVSRKLSSNLFISRTPQRRLDIKTENDTLKLYGYLNIVEASMYELMHVTPTPLMIGNNSFAIADLKLSTFAINFDQLDYFNLKEEELKTCSNTGNYTYLCAPAIVHNIDNSPSCIIDEIYERHTANSCEMRHVQLKGTIWKALMMKNTWLYISTEPKVVSVICKGARKELLLNATGIIHLYDDCFIKTKEVTLKTTIDQQFDVITSHIKQATVPPAINFTEVSFILQPGVLVPSNEQIIDYSLQPELLNANSLQKTLAVHTLTVTTSSLIAFIIAVCVYKRWDKIKEIFNSWRCDRSLNPSNQGRARQPTPDSFTIQHHFEQVLASAGPQHVTIRTD